MIGREWSYVLRTAAFIYPIDLLPALVSLAHRWCMRSEDNIAGLVISSDMYH